MLSIRQTPGRLTFLSYPLLVFIALLLIRTLTVHHPHLTFDPHRLFPETDINIAYYPKIRGIPAVIVRLEY